MELSAEPELVTRLGLPPGQIDGQENAVFGDKSQAAFERLRLRRIEVLRFLEALPLAPEGSALRGHQEVVLRAYDHAVRIGEFGHGRVELGDAYPYVMDHRSGVWIDLPDLLVRKQRVETRSDAEAYVSRLISLANAVEDARSASLALRRYLCRAPTATHTCPRVSPSLRSCISACQSRVSPDAWTIARHSGR